MKRKNILLIVFLLTLFVFQQAQASATIPLTGKMSNQKSVVPSNANTLSGYYYVYMFQLDDGQLTGDTHRGEKTVQLCQYPKDMDGSVYGCGTDLNFGTPFDPNNPNNGYWYVAEGYYLKNVIALEMNIMGLPHTPATLKAQAVASRTFAYYNSHWLSYGNSAIDNSTAYQVFIPGSFTSQSDVNSAVTDTGGQYLAGSDGYFILSEFASDSKDYTVTSSDATNPNNVLPYLTGVQDPISSACDSADNGHQGTPLKVRGMSQLGALRWSKGNVCANAQIDAPQTWSVKWDDYRQILAHYYTSAQFLDDGVPFAPDDRWNLLKYDDPPVANGTSYTLNNIMLQNTSTQDWTDAMLGYQWAQVATDGTITYTSDWTDSQSDQIIPTTTIGDDQTIPSMAINPPTDGRAYNTLRLDVKRGANGAWFSSADWPAAQIDGITVNAAPPPAPNISQRGFTLPVDVQYYNNSSNCFVGTGWPITCNIFATLAGGKSAVEMISLSNPRPSEVHAEYWGAIFEGKLLAPENGVYTISINNLDDGGKLYIDDMNAPVIASWIAQTPHNYPVYKYLTAGEHNLTVKFAQLCCGASMYVTWELPGKFAREVIHTMPRVVSITRGFPLISPTHTNNVDFVVKFSEPVTGVDLGDFTLTTTGVSGALIGGVTGSGAVYVAHVNTGNGDGSIRLDALDNGAIVSVALKQALVSGYTSGESYVIDKTNPTLPTIVADAGSTTVSFNTADNTDTFMCQIDSGSATACASPLALSAFPNGQHTLVVYAVDAAGNQSALAEPYIWTANNPPSVISSACVSAELTNLSNVDFTVAFSEPVTGVDVADFAVAMDGVSGASVASVTPVSGSEYKVSVDAGSGDGTLRLDVANDGSIQSLSSAALASGFTSGETYTINRTAPIVLSSARASANPTNAANVNFTVTFSAPVTGVDVADFSLATTGNVSGATISAVSGSGNVYTVTVKTGSASGALRLNVAGNATISNLVLLPNGFTEGEVYTINKLVVSSVARTFANPTNAADVAFTITFSEPVTGVDVVAPFNDFAVTGMSGSSVTGIIPDQSGRVYIIGVNNTVNASGTIHLNALNVGAIVTAGSIPLNSGYTAGQTYTIDRTAPATTLNNPAHNSATPDITFSGSDTGGSGGIAAYMCKMDGNDYAACVSPFHSALLANGSTHTFSVYAIDKVGNPDATPASHTWTVDIVTPTVNIFTAATLTKNLGIPITGFTASDNTAVTGYKITTTSTAPLVNAAGWTSAAPTTYTVGAAGSYTLYPWAKDAAGNVSSVFASPLSVTVDRTAPTVSSSAPTSTNPTNASLADFAVAFAEPVTGVDTADFTLTPIGVASATISSVSGSGSAYTVTVNTGAGDGTLRLDVKTSGTGVTDLAGNPLSGGFTSGKTYTIDKTTPATTLISKPNILDNNNTPTFTFSGDDGVGSGVVSFTCNMDGGSASCASPFTSSVLADGSHTFSVYAVDNAGNQDATPESYTWTLDATAPTVLSSVRASTNPTNASSVDFTVTFSEPVTNVDVNNVVLTTTGVSGATVSGVSGSGDVYTVTVNTGSGDGTIHLDAANNNMIVDAASNSLGGGFTSGETYTIDKTVPTVTVNQSSAQADPVYTANPINFTVVFSESINTSTFTSSDVTLVSYCGGTPSAATALVSEVAPNDGSTFNVAVSATCTVTVLLDAGKVSDLAGNTNTVSVSADNTVAIYISASCGNFYIPPIAANDGWALESSELSNLGGAINSISTLLVGDNAANKQFRSLLYFYTPKSVVPLGATIYRATVNIKKESTTGTDPFITHGSLIADMKKGFFGLSPLETTDFQALSSVQNVGKFTAVNGEPDWYTLDITQYQQYINQPGVTQFRLRFTLDDNNDLGNDFISFYAGDEVYAYWRPMLCISYYYIGF